MEAIRLHIRQSSANYRREETVGCRMTYPLPPYSTVIGALHKACGYTEYHPMKISVQGKYDSIIMRLFKEDCFFNYLQPDRETLVKMLNPDMLCSGYKVVAKALERNYKFSQDEKILVKDKLLLEEYRTLKDKKDNVGLSDFRTIVKAPKRCELLCNIELIIHISADSEILDDIENNIYNLTAIGRGEDFVEVLECVRIELLSENEYLINNKTFNAYIPINFIEDNSDSFYFLNSGEKDSRNGTKYLISKEYRIEYIDKGKEGAYTKRVFNKIPVLYTGGFEIIGNCKGVYFDNDTKNTYPVFLA